LDEHLAAFYGIETKALTRAVRRNVERFPDDFMFQLTAQEFDLLRRQFGTSSAWGGRRYRPLVFTEQGVAMLSSVLRSRKAVEINIQIMRAFVRLRQLLSLHKELADRLNRLENQMKDRDQAVAHQFREIFSLLEQLFNPPGQKKPPIGFLSETEQRRAKKKG
jgi:phage regulator Rha-like protein